MAQFQSIARFINPAYSHMALAKLKSENIECYLADEHTVTTFPHFGPAMGGVRLMVAEKDVDRANEILNLYESQALDLEEDEIERAANQEEDSFVDESSQRTPIGMNGRVALYLLFAVIIVIYVTSKYML